MAKATARPRALADRDDGRLSRRVTWRGNSPKKQSEASKTQAGSQPAHRAFEGVRVKGVPGDGGELKIAAFFARPWRKAPMFPHSRLPAASQRSMAARNLDKKFFWTHKTPLFLLAIDKAWRIKMLKRLGRMKFVQETLGFFLAAYIRLVRGTNRFTFEPPDLDKAIAGQTPVIVAMWHGQHFMISFAWPRSIARMAALISRHGDGGVNAAALRRLGVTPIRGSGARPGRKRDKGGVPAMREMLRALAGGASVAITADIPKQARVAGHGIVLLAKLSGRPIAPTAVVTSRRFDFKSWDRASLGKPFGRGAIVVGDLIHVAADADAQVMERARLAVEAGLDSVHARAYAKIGARDPGDGLRRD
jgi:lysophospholipid acyltransferase (LPLAT)-like uncharacterized protein